MTKQTSEHTSGNIFEPEQIFSDFEWQPNKKPLSLTLGKHGWLKNDDGDIYAVRRKLDDDGTQSNVNELYHGNKPSYHNATQGSGLYVAPVPDMLDSKVYFDKSHKDSSLYILKLAIKSDTDILDALEKSDETETVGNRMAKRALFSMAWTPGIPWPSPRMYDAMYNDKKFISFRPSAAQRIVASRSTALSIDGTTVKMPLRHGLVRDITVAQIIGTRTER